ncbi:MAG: PhoPQ-activated pathogenicity-related family protein [Armatimonadota bacterium]
MLRIVALLCITLVSLGRSFSAEPLIDYVSKPDASFSWRLLDETRLPNGDVSADLEMVSQTWQDIKWTHRMTLYKQANTPPQSLFLLFITGDYNKTEADTLTKLLGPILKVPIAILHNIPNQPLFGGKGEDALIAHTFVRYLETGDKTWPLLFPMTKAAVRAMDAVEKFAKANWNISVTGFVVSGASKRGWTTWLTAAVDKRVKGIAPMVYDNLNLPAQMKLQVESFGTYSEQIEDYTALNLPQMLNTKEGAQLAAIVDPYTFRRRITMPKLIICGTNDRYWPLDAATKYFYQLSGPKNILYVPNSGHGLEDRTRVVASLAAFVQACVRGKTLPSLAWSTVPIANRQVKLTVTSSTAPKSVSVWTTAAPTRDFRSAKWSRQTMQLRSGQYTAYLQLPRDAYYAAFAEAEFEDQGRTYTLSTIVRIFEPAGVRRTQPTSAAKAGT